MFTTLGLLVVITCRLIENNTHIYKKSEYRADQLRYINSNS